MKTPIATMAATILPILLRRKPIRKPPMRPRING